MGLMKLEWGNLYLEGSYMYQNNVRPVYQVKKEKFNPGDLAYGRNEAINDLHKNMGDVRFYGNKKINNATNRYLEPNKKDGYYARINEFTNDYSNKDNHVTNDFGLKQTFNSLGRQHMNVNAINHGQGNDKYSQNLKNMKFSNPSKGGIISAYRNKKKIHYVVDGIRFEDAFDRRSGKYESITSKELRFIYKNRGVLKDTVVWVNSDGASQRDPFESNPDYLKEYDQNREELPGHQGYFKTALLGGDLKKARLPATAINQRQHHQWKPRIELREEKRKEKIDLQSSMRNLVNFISGNAADIGENNIQVKARRDANKYLTGLYDSALKKAQN